MPCYSPLPALLVVRGGRRSISFDRKALGQGLSLPCGRCIGCRLERARQWAVRIMHEAKMHDENSFITLTYAKEHLPKDGTLVKRDVQTFFKRLRKGLWPKKIRFFACGEYGEKFGRPHYHAIVFGHCFPDRVPLSQVSHQRDVLSEVQRFTSKSLTDVWGKGLAEVGLVSFDSALYVANYATKKITGKDASNHYKGRVPEFLLMSRGGKGGKGIGFGFIDKFGPEVWARDEIIVRGQAARPPRYYDKVLEGRNSELLQRIKEDRRRKAEVLEEFTTPLGTLIRVPGDKNHYRLKVRETVARAKLALKRRNLEKTHD